MKYIFRYIFTILTVFSICLSAAAQKTTGNPKSQQDLLIWGGTVVTMDKDRRVIENGAVLVRGNKIVAVGKTEEIRPRSYAAINATGYVIIPGLINTHTHVPMSLFRGIADDLDLQEWLTNYIFPAEAKNVDEAFVRAGTRLGVAEMLLGGTTTYADMYYFEDAIADETAKAGMRAVLGETILDFPAPDNKTWADGIAYTERFIKKWQDHPLIVPAIAPHAPYTVSQEHLLEARGVADRLNAPLLIHLAEAKTETEYTQQKYKGMRPIEFVDSIGFLKGKTVAAHVVQANEKELDILKRRDVGVAHNPQSNMKLAAGVAPVPAMLERGMRVGLGTDGAASNNDLNIWEEMDTAAKLHKVFSGDPKVVSAEQAFEMATIGGARALYMEDRIGSLEAGKLADIVLVDLRGLKTQPMYNVYSHLVYAAKSTDVKAVIIDGKMVMQNGRLFFMNESAIKRDANAYREKIINSLSKK